MKISFLPQRHEDTKIFFLSSSCLCAFVASFFAFLLSGCISLDSSSKKDEVAEMRSSVSQELINVKQEVNSLKGQIEELDYRLDKISETQKQQSNEINTTLKEWRKEIQNNVEGKIQIIDKKQTQNHAELEEKDKIIIEEITKENKELRRQIDSIKPSVTYAAEEGYYIVSEGDTLSKIAQRFGVSIKTLMEANGITDPNSIRKGQKLAIPK